MQNKTIELYQKIQQERNIANMQEIKEDATILRDMLLSGEKIPRSGKPKSPRDRAVKLYIKITNRMKKWGSLYGESTIDVCNNIINDEVGWLCSIFSKDPAKQNLSEEVHSLVFRAANIKFKKLENRGPNQITFLKGVKRVGPVPRKEREYGANCDFCVFSSFGETYTTNKITQGSGGLQEAQVKCVVHFIENAKLFIDNNPRENIRFAAIVDGSTFTMNNNAHLNDLLQMIEGYESMIFVGTAEQFVKSKFAI